jgi:hypothetical protein
MVGKCSARGREENTYEILVGKPEGKGPVGRRKCKLWDNIKMDLRDMELDSSILG